MIYCCELARQNLKYENFTSSFGRLRQNIAPKSVPHVQHDYFYSFNQSNHLFVAYSLTLPSSNLKLPGARSRPEGTVFPNTDRPRPARVLCNQYSVLNFHCSHFQTLCTLVLSVVSSLG